jgi:zinc/manganese transport system substrate-binding protein
MVQRQSANPKIRPDAPGAFEAAAFVRMLEVPTRLDRADGDVHAAGNPHIQTDPRNILAVAQSLAERLAAIDPANATHYRDRHRAFAARWTAALERWAERAMPLRGVPVAVQHKNWTYMLDWLGLKEVVTLEPKPGVPPSAGHLAQVAEEVRRQPVRMVIHAAYEDNRPSQFLGDRAGVPVVSLPFTVGGSDGARDLFGLFDDTLARLLDALNARKP